MTEDDGTSRIEPTGPSTIGLPAARSSYTPVQRFRLDVIDGPDAGKTVTSSSVRTVVGSHKAADLVLADPAVSRFHVELAIEGGRAVVRDLGSRNGTFVGGVQVVVAYVDGRAVLQIGQSTLRYTAEADPVRVPLAERERFGRMVGSSNPTRAMFAVLERAAASDVTVLLLGETGVGKDVAAESIHDESARAAGPFVVADCGSIPGSLLESELFGHEKGAFTGAVERRIGAFEAASGGTLFVDEVGELALELQPRLLRALERREIRRVGGNASIPIDVRLIAATNRDLRAEVNAGRFRADLYYRLAVLEVVLPPLRDRREDLPALVDAIVDSLGPAPPAIAEALRAPAFQSELARYAWPGNVRELRNVIERSVMLEALEVPGTAPNAQPEVDAARPLRLERERWLREFERRYVDQLLARHGDNVAAAARAAGIDRTSFYRLLARCGRQPSRS